MQSISGQSFQSPVMCLSSMVISPVTRTHVGMYQFRKAQRWDDGEETYTRLTNMEIAGKMVAGNYPLLL